MRMRMVAIPLVRNTDRVGRQEAKWQLSDEIEREGRVRRSSESLIWGVRTGNNRECKRQGPFASTTRLRQELRDH